MSNDNWKMPQPVFQRTSGSLPEDLVARIAFNEKPTPINAAPNDAVDNGENEILSTLYAPPGEILQPDEPTPGLTPPSVQPAIEAQPLISEQFSVAEIDTSAPSVPFKKRGGSRSIIISVVVFVLLAITVCLVAVIYLFVRNSPESTF